MVSNIGAWSDRKIGQFLAYCDLISVRKLGGFRKSRCAGSMPIAFGASVTRRVDSGGADP